MTAPKIQKSDAPPSAASDLPSGSSVAPVLIALGPTVVLSTIYFLLPVIAPAIMNSLERRAEDFGLLAGMVGFGSVWFYCVSHAITPVLGPLGALRFGLLVTIAGCALLYSGQWPLMLLGGALFGFGYGTTTPASSQILADFTPRKRWGILFSLRQAGVPAGGIFAGILSMLLLAAYGWHLTMLVCIAVVALLLAALHFVPARYNSSRPLARFSLGKLLTPANFWRPFATTRELPGLTSLVAAGCGFAMVHGAVTSFFVLYLVETQGMPQKSAAALFIVLQSTAILGRVVFGALADRLGSPLPVLGALAPLSALSAILLSVITPAWPPAAYIAAALVIGLTVGTWNGLYLAEIARLAPQEKIASATAAAAVFGFATYTITPPLVGLLVWQYGWVTAFRVVALAALFAGLVLALRRRRTHRPS